MIRQPAPDGLGFIARGEAAAGMVEDFEKISQGAPVVAEVLGEN